MLAFIGPETIVIVVLVGIVVFGGSKIPDLARSLGRAKGEFQKGLSEGNVPETGQAQAPAAPQAAPAAPAPAQPASPEAPKAEGTEAPTP